MISKQMCHLPLSHLLKTLQSVQRAGCTEINKHLICSPACFVHLQLVAQLLIVLVLVLVLALVLVLVQHSPLSTHPRRPTHACTHSQTSGRQPVFFRSMVILNLRKVPDRHIRCVEKSIKYLWTAKVDDNLVKMVKVLQVT